ncbi:nucleotide exchange factor GrpE [Acanthopleuribacter pedis]|uniref:Nucleotide exchange factor GrpE n=1 Tax=Acanthopleuribacter pedis TaxID=442870 RepID=A0A8J7QGM3_9BACT|nr:nucleotide exchange factor GrpE [Acanthopleuribacter pedis]MBO1318205.1 nucleotide exchange factor GrpE [Acanthopleuribacter pedis]
MPKAPADIEPLVERFRHYLSQDCPEPNPEADMGASALVLHREMTQLKSEVRRETRILQDGLQQFEGACAAIEVSRGVMEQLGATQQADLDARVETQVRELIRPILLDMIMVCDKLHAEHQAMKDFKPGWSGRVFAKEAKLLATVTEGREALTHRLQNQLAQYGLEPIPTLGLPFDGRFMKVGEVVHQADQEDGLVTGELLPGYTWRDEVLRYAEVQVNRGEGGNDGAPSS